MKTVLIVFIAFLFLLPTTAHANVLPFDNYKTADTDSRFAWLAKENKEIAEQKRQIAIIRKHYKKSQRDKLMGLIYWHNYRVAIYNARAFAENRITLQPTLFPNLPN